MTVKYLFGKTKNLTPEVEESKQEKPKEKVYVFVNYKFKEIAKTLDAKWVYLR